MSITYSKYKIPIYDRVITIWDHDIHETNRKTLEFIDEEYFKAMSEILMKEKANNKYIYYSLFQSYYSSLEVMFSLLCAVLQAPYFFYPWIMKYRNDELLRMVGIIDNNGTLTNAHNLSVVSWEVLAEIIHPIKSAPEIEKNKKLFPKIWTNMAKDFVNTDYIEAYNSIKHGLRVRNDAITQLQIDDIKLNGSEYGIEFGTIKKHQTISVLKRKTVNINAETFDYIFDFIRGTVINIKSYLKSISLSGNSKEPFFILREDIVKRYLDIEPITLTSVTWNI